MRKLHPWSNDPICRMDVTGFLSIMVVLLAIFWAPVFARPDLPFRRTVDMIHSGNAVAVLNAAREDAMVVTVRRDGRILFRAVQISPDELTARIGDALKQHAERRIYINADRRAKYSSVRICLEAIQAAGVKEIAFLTS